MHKVLESHERAEKAKKRQNNTNLNKVIQEITTPVDNEPLEDSSDTFAKVLEKSKRQSVEEQFDRDLKKALEQSKLQQPQEEAQSVEVISNFKNYDTNS